MTRRTVWAVSAGSYSSYRVLALYEDRADAEAMARPLQDSYDGSFVEEFELYSPGDRSRREGPVWIARVRVGGNATLHDLGAERHDGHVDDDGPVDEPVSVERDSRRYLTDSAYLVTGRGLTKKQAVKGAKDRAAEVAAMILDGLDPREIMWGRPSEHEIASAHEAALADEARLQKEREATARARRKAALLTQWSRRLVALFDGDTQVGERVQFGSGHVPLPESFTGDPHQLQLRDEHGAVAAPEVQVGQVLRLGKPPLAAIMWSRVLPEVIEIGDDVILGASSPL